MSWFWSFPTHCSENNVWFILSFISCIFIFVFFGTVWDAEIFVICFDNHVWIPCSLSIRLFDKCWSGIVCIVPSMWFFGVICTVDVFEYDWDGRDLQNACSVSLISSHPYVFKKVSSLLYCFINKTVSSNPSQDRLFCTSFVLVYHVSLGHISLFDMRAWISNL